MRDRPDLIRDRPMSTPEPLASWLADLRLSHTFLVVGRIGGTTGVRIEAEGSSAFHYCQRGPCVVAAEGHAPIPLGDGDFLFMRDGLARVVWPGDRPPRRARAVAFTSLVRSVERDAAVAFSIGTAAQTVLGGAFCIDSPETRMFLGALPPVFCVRRGAVFTSRLVALVDQLVEEATTSTPGASPVVARLAEVMVLIAIRSYATTGDGSPLLEAARDPKLGRALAAIHREPARAWTVAELGRVAGMSRSSFADAFAARVGEGPATYVTRVRMARAERLLREEDWPLTRIAGEVGYASTAAFSVAFKRQRGLAPSAIRTRRRA
jgi:AraC-like DNA-binding protein